MLIWRLTSDRAPTDPAAASAMERLFKAPDWTWAEAGGVGWWVLPAWRDRLLDARGRLRLDEWRQQHRLQVVKSGPHREVFRVELAGSSPHEADTVVYIKHHLVPDRRSRWRQWLRRGKGRNEAQRAARLSAFGVPTISVVALGEHRRRGFLFDNYLVSIELPGMLPLDRFLERQLSEQPVQERGPLWRRLAQELGTFIARLHTGGFVHTDFHPGNVMIRLEDDGTPRLAMIDLDALRVRNRLSLAEAEQNLAVLNHGFWLRTSRTDRLRCLRAYMAARGLPEDMTEPIVQRIEGKTRRWAEHLWRRWGRRCTGDSKAFTAVRGPYSWGVASRTLDPQAMRTLLRDPDAPFHQAATRRIKSSRTTDVAETILLVDGFPTPVIYKRFNRKKWLDPIYSIFRPSRGWRAWQNGQHVTSRGLPTPRNLAWIAQAGRGRGWLPRCLRCPHETYLVTEKLEPSQTLWEVAYQSQESLDPKARRAQIDRIRPQLARLIRTLHDRSLTHRDLKAANVLVAPASDPNAPVQLSLIDLVGVRIETPLLRRHRVQNLARLQLSLAAVPGRTRTDSLRFLREYLPWSLTPRAEWKALWREVESACEHKIAQNRRRKRLIS